MHVISYHFFLGKNENLPICKKKSEKNYRKHKQIDTNRIDKVQIIIRNTL